MGKVEGMLHHHKKDESSSTTEQPTSGSTGTEEHNKKPQKESEMDKFKGYMAEDKKLEAEGKEYGGLM